ncbi:hypothetical protein O3M35_010823 [Rhynocoris fuscipes]|uniref:Uncharacterized protein n=1 Tax=Rhynocoris fuscipes TaxID=488301 RepID=A0AAW1D1E7_9HEMI
MDELAISEKHLEELMNLLDSSVGIKSKFKSSEKTQSSEKSKNVKLRTITNVKSKMKKTKEDMKRMEISDETKKKDVSKTNKSFIENDYKNLNEFISDDESDSLESDYDEERGFIAADNFLTMNELSKELDKREKMIKNALKESENEFEMKKKSEEEERKELLALENELKFDKKQFEDELMKFPDIDEDFKMKTEQEEEEIYVEKVDDTDNDENLQQELLKLVESLENRVKNYKFTKTDLENFYDPVEGLTIHKLQNYFQNQTNSKHEKTVQDENERKFQEFSNKIDILYPLSTKEKRLQLERLFSDIKSKTFQRIKYEHSEKVHTEFNHLFKQKIFTKNEAENDDMLDSIDVNKDKAGKLVQEDGDFEIMFSDVSTSGDEEDFDDVLKLSGKEQARFREKCDTVIQGLKENTRKQKRNVSGLERLVNKYMKKYEADERRKKEFARWFGTEESKDDKRSGEVPIWKPDVEQLEEYRNLLSEYEQFDKVECQDNDEDENIEEEKVKETGEKWIKIKKGTLMRDYQVRCRQGMYYLVEKKHIQKKQRKLLSKKRMMRAENGKTAEEEKKNKKSKRSIKRYLGKKKVAKKKQQSEKKMFTKRGEAIEEIRKILAHLESKPFDQKLKETDGKTKKKSEWTREKFVKYFKEKCRELGAEVCSDDEEDTSREVFRKYCCLYFETMENLEMKKRREKENERFPLNLFKTNKTNDDFFEKYETDGDLKSEKSTDEKFPMKDLITEIFQFKIEDIIKDDDIQSSINKESNEFNHLKFHFDNKLLNETYKKQKTKSSLPLHYSEQFDLPIDIKNRAFRLENSVDLEKIKEHLSVDFLTNEKHYLRAKPSNRFSKIHTEVINEMKNENLINRVNYKFLNDKEAIFPWNEIQIEFEDIPVNISEIKSN